MIIGLCYDTKQDYGFDELNLEFTDFTTLETVTEIGRAIEKNGYTVKYIGALPRLVECIDNNSLNCDLIFNIAEGFNSRNREALIPSLLEIKKIPFTASDTYGMSINLNKYHTKILVESLGIPTPKAVCFKVLNKEIVNKVSQLTYPLIVKPNCEGGSMATYLIYTHKELIEKIEQIIQSHSCELLVEEYIDGHEITVPIIGSGASGNALDVVTITMKDGSGIPLYDSSIKLHDADNVNNSVNVSHPHGVKEKLLRYSEMIHTFFDFKDYSRMDFRVKDNGDIYFLEVNTMPYLGRGGSFEVCANSIGKEYHEIIGEIIMSARTRYNM
ncbi:MAG: ATP-grasp domain-containing protein [Eubacteriales bacterium]